MSELCESSPDMNATGAIPAVGVAPATGDAGNSGNEHPRTPENETPEGDNGADPACERAKVFEAIISCSDPAELAPRWRFLQSSRDVFRLAVAPFELAGLLTKNFEFQLLMETGVIKPAGEITILTPELEGDGALFRVLRDDDKRPTRVVTPSGQLFVATGSSLDYALARRDSGSSDPPSNVLVCELYDDVAILSALNFNAVTVDGLENLCGSEWRRIFEPGQADNNRLHHLVLVDFELSKLSHERMPRIENLIRAIASVEGLYNIEPHDRFSVWRPTERELHRMRTGVELRDAEAIHSAIADSLHDVRNRPPTCWNAHLQHEVLTYTEAKARLERALARSDPTLYQAEISAALKGFLNAMRNSIIAPIDQSVDAAREPLAKLARADASVLASEQVEGHPLVLAARAILSNQPRPNRAPDRERIAERLQRRKELQSIFKLVNG